MLKIILIVPLLSLPASVNEGWMSLVPLRSTRGDVERLLGPPSGPCKGLCRYETKSEVIFVRYSQEPCSNKDDNRWLVPPDTVTELHVNLEKRPKLSSLKLNLKNFKRTDDPELHGYTSYTSEELGVSYSVSVDSRVYSINKFPSRKDDEALICRRSDR